MSLLRSFVRKNNNLAFVIGVLICAAATSAAIIGNILSYQVQPVSSAGWSSHVLVIDPGHGGIDGGAIGVDGSKESDINLAIAQKMSRLAAFCGKKSVLTRTDDTSNCDYSTYSEHKELVRRSDIANNTPEAVLISIHQNCYPTAQPHGAHVIYADNGLSETLGTIIQSNITGALENDSRRLAQPDRNKLYILSNASCPAVLVECGFMSNHFDIGKLNDDGYRKSLSTVLFASYLQYISGTKTI